MPLLFLPLLVAAPGSGGFRRCRLAADQRETQFNIAYHYPAIFIPAHSIWRH
jgi:hypothetical protein